MPPDRTGWKKPLPARLPRPTYWPAMLALGFTVALLGPVTDQIFTFVGLALAAAAIAGWVGEMLHG